MNLKLILRVIIVIAFLFGLYLGYSIFQGNSIKRSQFEYTIDSLSKKNSILDSMLNNKDSIITVYQDKVVYLDSVIEKEKSKYFEIRQKYTKIYNIVSSYKSNQIDSFFKNRYAY